MEQWPDDKRLRALLREQQAVQKQIDTLLLRKYGKGKEEIEYYSERSQLTEGIALGPPPGPPPPRKPRRVISAARGTVRLPRGPLLPPPPPPPRATTVMRPPPYTPPPVVYRLAEAAALLLLLGACARACECLHAAVFQPDVPAGAHVVHTAPAPLPPRRRQSANPRSIFMHTCFDDV